MLVGTLPVSQLMGGWQGGVAGLRMARVGQAQGRGWRMVNEHTNYAADMRASHSA